MDVVATLKEAAGEIIDEATQALGRAHLHHYEQMGEVEDRQRLQTLLDVVIDCIDTRQLTPIVNYAEGIARERHSAGFDIGEVQTAFNVLEEATWRRVVAATRPDQLAEAVGLLSTVLGAGKDALARAYVSLATERHVPSLDLRAMFGGT